MPPPQQPKRRGRPSKKQIAEREGKLAEYEASEKSSKKKQVRWDDGYHSKAAMDDDLGDKADDDDENFKDGQELKDDGTLRKNPVGFDEYLSKIGVEPAENDEQMTGSIKSFCQKRRKVVYESINKDTEEEERFVAAEVQQELEKKCQDQTKVVPSLGKDTWPETASESFLPAGFLRSTSGAF